MNYSKLDFAVSRFLDRFPKLKQRIKRVYQWVNYLKHRQKDPYISDMGKICSRIGGQEETFFGYYDKTPLNRSKMIVLYHAATQGKTSDKPNPKTPIQIKGKNLLTGQTLTYGQTHAYNWQQGARLQWVNDDHFIYNRFDEKSQQYQSNLTHCKTTQSKPFSFPVYDVYQAQALYLNFDRLALIRPDYGYFNRLDSIDQKRVLSDLKNDGVFLGDLNKGSSKLLISLEQIIDFQFQNPPNATHWVNHMMISPNGHTFVFLHRYILNGARYDRLILADMSGTLIRVLADDKMVSHYHWMNEKTLIGYLRDDLAGNHYYLVDVHTGQKKVLNQQLASYGDGHPTVYANHLVLDTYPNKARHKSLLYLNLETGKMDTLCTVYESLKYHGESRCDCHPRLSSDRLLFFDSVHEGKRGLYMMDIQQ